jgi:hypothetical protein
VNITHMVWCERKKCDGECTGSLKEAYLSVQLQQLERVNKILMDALEDHLYCVDEIDGNYSDKAIEAIAQVKEILK